MPFDLQIGQLTDSLQEMKDSAKVALKDADSQREQYQAETQTRLQAAEAVHQVCTPIPSHQFENLPANLVRHACCPKPTSCTMCNRSKWHKRNAVIATRLCCPIQYSRLVQHLHYNFLGLVALLFSPDVCCWCAPLPWCNIHRSGCCRMSSSKRHRSSSQWRM